MCRQQRASAHSTWNSPILGPARAAPTRDNHVAKQRLRLLVVDDDLAVREVIAEGLQMAGYSVHDRGQRGRGAPADRARSASTWS